MYHKQLSRSLPTRFKNYILQSSYGRGLAPLRLNSYYHLLLSTVVCRGVCFHRKSIEIGLLSSGNHGDDNFPGGKTLPAIP